MSTPPVPPGQDADQDADQDASQDADQDADQDRDQDQDRAPGRVVVVGSVNRDVVLHVTARPQAGETVLAVGQSTGPGGKGANQAVAAALAGAPTTIVGAVGDDAEGTAMLDALRSAGVGTDAVEVLAGVPTGVAMITVDPDGDNAIVVGPGANAEVDPDAVDERVRSLAATGDVVVLQAEVPEAVVAAAVAAAVQVGARVVLNLAPYRPTPAQVLAACDPLVLNEEEAAALAGRPASTPEQATDVARAIAGTTRSVVVTLGGAGAVLARDGSAELVPASAVEVVDTTGAGDALTGVLAARLVAGDDLPEAVRHGVAAGSWAVGRAGAQASFPTAADLGLPERPG